MRGANHNHGLDAGVFTYYPEYGRATGWLSFRVEQYYVKRKKI